MDWMESHGVRLNYKMKQLSLTNDLGHSRMIVGRNQGVSLRFISSLQLQNIMCKGCKLYIVLVLNKKGNTKGLENLPVVSELVDVFLEELSGLSQEREFEFTIYLKHGMKLNVRNPHWMSTPELQELKMQLKE
jgi:hypothetical protein